VGKSQGPAESRSHRPGRQNSQAHDVGSGSPEDCGFTAGTMGEAQEGKMSGAIHQKIQAFFGSMKEHGSDHSWEHCYRYFHGAKAKAIAPDRDHAALQLGFYLASWGIYRPSGFLFKHDYMVHLAVVDHLVTSAFSVLWEQEFGGGSNDQDLVKTILQACEGVRSSTRQLRQQICS
jgi:hypothetical protein